MSTGYISCKKIKLEKVRYIPGENNNPGSWELREEKVISKGCLLVQSQIDELNSHEQSTLIRYKEEVKRNTKKDAE